MSPVYPITVYIPDLPGNIGNDQLLENMIFQRLEHAYRIRVLNIKCTTQLGVGCIYLHDNKDKNYLIKDLHKIVIDPSKNATISFVDELKLTSYIVIHTIDVNHLPSTKDICQRWIQVYEVDSQPKCERLCLEFPNIFRIITYSLDELMEATSIKDFGINSNQFATIYFNADCSFFEDLPRTTNYYRLEEAISKQISDKYMSKESIYIQYNKDGANAVVLTSGEARIWSLQFYISLDGKRITKRANLTSRLLIHPVPKDMLKSLIRDHEIFGGCVTTISHTDEYVILELSDRNIYEKCIEQGALRIGGCSLHINKYSSLSKPEDFEIDDETWYETEMCDYKPDIMPFISNPQHRIFKLKWNSQAFLKEFHRFTSNDGNINVKDRELCNLKCQLLRMTVMLNTIGVVKKGHYYLNEKEIKIKSDRLKTILYDHQSKLEHNKIISLSQLTKFPYKSTSIKVVNEDCLVVYNSLVKKGFRPVIFNRSDPYSPGGRYRQGSSGQEETFFRRSNYFQSLDLELNDGKRTACYYCDSNCNLKSLDTSNLIYPIDEYGAIYTSGLTVFRQPENTGYAFMDTPIYDVCAIAMSAYRHPKIDNKNFLTSTYSIGTRKKIENIFSIAYHHKHDSIVLPAFGCGALKNPPYHIAMIFKSVIEQYAGFFKCIYFAIIDDYNTGEYLNRNGNYHSFQMILDDLIIKPKSQQIVDMMIGSWRILNQSKNNEITLSDVKIYYLKPCRHGGKCYDINNKQHTREYSHPPLCPNTNNITSCKEKKDEEHMLWFRHRQMCLNGGECPLIEHDQKHLNEYEHPEFCRHGGQCENMNAEHLKSYRHVPLCTYGRKCVEYNRASYEHCQNLRHCAPIDRSQLAATTYSTNYKSDMIISSSPEYHSEQTYGFSNHRGELPYDESHFSRMICRFGSACHNQNDAKHCQMYSHSNEQRQHSEESHYQWKIPCRYGIKCRDFSGYHRSKYSHPKQ